MVTMKGSRGNRGASPFTGPRRVLTSAKSGLWSSTDAHPVPPLFPWWRRRRAAASRTPEAPVCIRVPPLPRELSRCSVIKWAQSTKRAKNQASWRGRRSRRHGFLRWRDSTPLGDSEVPTFPVQLWVSANPSAGGGVLSNTTPPFPTGHRPPPLNLSTPRLGGATPRVVVPAVTPVVLILLRIPPFMVQFARESLVKWTKGAVGTHVLPRRCPLRPTFPNTSGRESKGRFGGG